MNEQVKEPSARKLQVDARRARVADQMPQSIRVRVNPRDDTIRKHIAHPKGIKFPESGSVEWPLDTFTKRRLRDGTVTREEAREEGERGARGKRGASSARPGEHPNPAEPKAE